MSLSMHIAPHLPYLRRFSRALTGNQTSGDAYVVAVLEAIVADPTNFVAEPDLKISLYGKFCELWETLSLDMHNGHYPNSWEELAQRKLSKISPAARIAFLLFAVEGFSHQDIAKILGQNDDMIEQLLEEASRTILDEVAANVMIIEDEPLIALDLQFILESLGHRVVGVARTETEAIQLASQSNPQLVLADIQLADGSSGIDAVNAILSNRRLPVIFITAYPERLLTGEKPEPAFLITKPFLADMVKALVSQALFFNSTATADA